MDWHDILNWQYSEAVIPAFSWDKPQAQRVVQTTPMSLLQQYEPQKVIHEYRQMKEVEPKSIVVQELPPQQRVVEKHYFQQRKGLNVYPILFWTLLTALGITAALVLVGNAGLFGGLWEAIQSGWSALMGGLV